MQELVTRHIGDLVLEVAFAESINIGQLAQGRRVVAPIVAGKFEGPNLAAKLLPRGHDWAMFQNDGSMRIDVRLSLQTEKGDAIYVAYEGWMKAAPAVMARFLQGEQLQPEEYYLRTVVRFECSADHLSWLNDTIFVGVGEQLPTGVKYSVYQVE